MRFLSLAAFLITILLASTTWSQIDVPKETLEHHPIPVSVAADVPTEGRVIRMGPGWIIPPGLNVYQCQKNQLVVCGAPGEYVIGYKITWIALERVTFTDSTGKEVVVWSYVGNGQYDTDAKFTILGGGDDGPDPPQPPTPGGKHRIMIFYDADRLDNYTRGQRLILTSLAVREAVKKAGHSILELHDASRSPGSVPEKFQSWYTAIEGKNLPVIALAPIKDAGPIHVYPLPTSEKELMELLK